LFLSKLFKLTKSYILFPLIAEIVLRVQKRAKDATEWIAYVADILKKGKKIPLNEAKVLADKGDKLNVSCPEYKTVRAALKATKAWLTKVKKCGAKDGQAEVATSVVNELINEHKTFLVTSEDSLSGLQQVMCGYCVCRQPYEGFMIGCDTLLFLIAYMIARVLLYIRVGLASVRRSIISNPNPHFFKCFYT